MDVRFTVLGPVEVLHDGRALTGLAPRHRAVLAYLLLHAGTVIGSDRLTSAVWAGSPPGTARSQIHAAVTTIRRVLRVADADSLLETRSAGYVLTPPPGALDLAEFGRMVEESRREGGAAGAAGLREALALWRGEALTGVNAGYVAGARARLEERRLAAFEQLVEWESDLGRHASLVEELSTWVAAHPLRERLTAQLMRVLHLSGRQADALAAGRRYRTSLAEEQGLDPGSHFLAVEREVLRDRSRPAPAAPDPAPRVVDFLPYDVPDFTGRAVELDRLTRAVSDHRVCVVDGMAGVGKTTLAVHAAHRLADRYPDGRLFIDLRAHSSGHSPSSSFDALDALLRQTGVPADHIPLDAHARAALWRERLADRAVLIVLDNVADTGQVRPLLPGASRSTVLMTSRRRLTDLDGVHALSLDVLPAPDAMALFVNVVGDRARHDYAASGEVLRLCGHLPLAVRIAAARLQHRPRWTVGYLADRLRDERRRLTELTTAERDVAAAFHLSYRQLPASQRRMFRLLGVHPGRDVDAHAAAALAGVEVMAAESDLEDLLDAHMLLQHEPGRYTFHDLLREHSRATGASEDDDASRTAALSRLIDHCLRTSVSAADVLHPDSRHRRPDIPPANREFTPEQATAWLDAERANLAAVCEFAAVRDWPAQVADLATLLYRYLYNNGHGTEAQVVFTAALTAARRGDDAAAQSRALSDLGWLWFGRGGYPQALEHFEEAVAKAAAAGDDVAHARAQHGVACVLQRRGEDAEAVRRFTTALELFTGAGDDFGRAVALNSLGALHGEADRFTEALAALRTARDTFRSSGSPDGEADVLDNLGRVHRRRGRLAEAEECHRAALELYRRFGIRRGEARSLNGLGAVASATGARDRAAGHHRAAIEAAGELGDRLEEARGHEGMASLLEPGAPEAREHAARALDLFRRLGQPAPAALLALAAPAPQAAHTVRP
ncbi:DNA-binding SARP family transcriptional activator [Stackebrandtia albiflava]|uniref:DNA-binding SARP family transcriptional activator n=1 Tax=Stackebrandtia albiflava TaxID=406432 RepID=A0A562V4K8_9ACTN|nr:BTAD domain-containing putative transcriptional regulator [Stackebrandtia albiflava]TWJ12813.1 DNA-binding SARP family transcriptional activator [Stackebrandtia albiflava]